MINVPLVQNYNTCCLQATWGNCSGLLISRHHNCQSGATSDGKLLDFRLYRQYSRYLFLFCFTRLWQARQWLTALSHLWWFTRLWQARRSLTALRHLCCFTRLWQARRPLAAFRHMGSLSARSSCQSKQGNNNFQRTGSCHWPSASQPG